MKKSVRLNVDWRNF